MNQNSNSFLIFRPSPMLLRRALASIMTRSVAHSRSIHSVSQWNGLETWRSAPIDERRMWGKDGPSAESLLGGGSELLVRTRHGGGVVPDIENELSCGRDSVSDLANWGALVLVTADPLEKAWLTHQAFRSWTKGELSIGMATAPDVPGRPPKPELVSPRLVPSPKDCALGASAHMLHNLAHIELNAIDLAWDTVVRFSCASEELGTQFFADFLHVADDESRHFRWCSQRLNELGFSYGDMPAHNLLWRDCLKTSGNVKSRLAVIPMMQEARGLDAGPRLVKRLLGLADHRSAAIVQRIGEEEIAHVAVGVSHFLQVCKKLKVNPGDEFKELMVECNIELRGPFNHNARAKAGLPRDWYDSPDLMESSEVHEGQAGSPVKSGSGRMASEGGATMKKVETGALDKATKQQQESSESSPIKCKGEHIPDKKVRGRASSCLPEVYDRLALLVAMEKKNAQT